MRNTSFVLLMFVLCGCSKKSIVEVTSIDQIPGKWKIEINIFSEDQKNHLFDLERIFFLYLGSEWRPETTKKTGRIRKA
jgi:hypothetical protein